MILSCCSNFRCGKPHSTNENYSTEPSAGKEKAKSLNAQKLQSKIEQLAYGGPALQHVAEVFVVSGQQGGGVQPVGALGSALTALEAILDLAHLLLPDGSEPGGGGSPAEHQRHPGAVVDLNTHGAGHTVATATAEIAGEHGPVLFDQGREFFVHGRGIGDVAEELIQLMLTLDAPQGQHAVILGQVCVGRPGIVDQTAGQGLHGKEAHACFPAQLHNLQIGFGGEIAEGELEGFIEAGLDGLLCNAEPVVGDADVADLALGFGLEHGFVQTGAVAGLGAEGRVVELIDVDVAQVGQADLQIGPELLCCCGGGFGGDKDLLTHLPEGQTHLVLGVGVAPGGVEEPDAAVIGLAQQHDRVIIGHTLYGQRAEAVFVDCNAGGAESDHFHKYIPP